MALHIHHQPVTDPRLMRWLTHACGLAALVLFAGSALLWIASHPGFAIKQVKVTGDMQHISKQDIQHQMGDTLQAGLFRTSLEALRSSIEQLPWVEQVRVRRVFPNRLALSIQEHKALAVWKYDIDPVTDQHLTDSLRFISTDGQIFDAEPDEQHLESMPLLTGPAGQEAAVKAMYEDLKQLVAPLNFEIKQLKLSRRGSWLVTFTPEIRVELGSTNEEDIQRKVRQFVATLPLIAQQYGRPVSALVSADLRYSNGFAAHFRGVSIVETTVAEQLAHHRQLTQQ